MLAWLWNLLVGQFCTHKWVCIAQTDLYRYAKAELPHGRRYTLECSKCGNIKSTTVS